MSALLSWLFSLQLSYKSPVETKIQLEHLIIHEEKYLYCEEFSLLCKVLA